MSSYDIADEKDFLAKLRARGFRVAGVITLEDQGHTVIPRSVMVRYPIMVGHVGTKAFIFHRGGGWMSFSDCLRKVDDILYGDTRMNLTKSDIRFMCWVAGSPRGAIVKRVSAVIGKLERHGLVQRDGMDVILTGLGWHALIESGKLPQDMNGRTLHEVVSVQRGER